MEQNQKDKLNVKIWPTREEMGAAAAADASALIQKLQKQKEHLNLVFAAAPSQNEFLKALSQDSRIDFSRITAYHMDEYIGLPADAPQGFGNFLKAHIFGLCPFAEVHYINGGNPDPEKECLRYSELLSKVHIDVVLMGIGENGHIAFNDPSIADFHDPKMVKVVTLEQVCRQQQVNDGCFEKLEQVPEQAITLTVPTLMNADYHFCMVPSKLKAKAVHSTLEGPISETCPASILRTAPNACLYLDQESASLLKAAEKV